MTSPSLNLSDTTPAAGESRAFSEHHLIVDYFEQRGCTDGLMLDIGAYEGQSFEPFLDLGWRVHAFEPDPARRASLARFDHDPNVDLHYVAVSDEPCEVAAFYASDDAPAISTLSPFHPSHREVSKVRVTTLSEMLAEIGSPRVDYLKSDAEGFDLQVLRGFPWDLQRPEVVLCEFEDAKTEKLGYHHHDLGTFLLDLGYRVYLSEWKPIVRYGGSHHWSYISTYPCELLNLRAWGNFIAVRPEHAEEMDRAVIREALADRSKQVEDLKTHSAALQTIRNDLTDRNDQIAELRAVVRRREAAIDHLKAEMNKRNEAIERLRQSLQDRNDAIAELRKAVEERNLRLRESRLSH